MKHGNLRNHILSGKKIERSWIVTFNDLLTIVFTFFALILAFSVPQPEYLSQLAHSFRQTWGIGSVDHHKVIPELVNATRDRDIEREKAKKNRRMEASLKALGADLFSLMRDFPYLSLTINHSIFRVTVPRTFVFQRGTEYINESSKEPLRRIAQSAGRHEAYVRVEITRNISPQQKSLFDTEWKETAGQLAALARFFSSHEDVQPERISLTFTENESQGAPKGNQVVLLISPARL